MERLGGVLKRLRAFLQAIWSDAENVEKPLFPLFLDSWLLLEASWSVLEPSWSCLGAAAGADATFDGA